MLTLTLTWNQLRELLKILPIMEVISRFSQGKVIIGFTGTEAAWDEKQVVLTIWTED